MAATPVVSESEAELNTAFATASAAKDRTAKADRSSDGFNHRLEALRGVAAMMVALGHSIVILPSFGWQESAVPLLQLIMNGRAAVTLFFVLSGLVLGMSLRRSTDTLPVTAITFYVRRFFRIYPAFLICTTAVLAYVFSGIIGETPAAASPWFARLYELYRLPPTPGRVALNFAFSGNSYNVVVWTLKVEMLCSACLPLVHWVSARASKAQLHLLFWGLLLLWLTPASGSLGYLFMFLAGYLLPIIGPRLFGPLCRSQSAAACFVAVATALLLCSRLIANPELVTRLGVVLEAFAATVLIASLLYGGELKIYRILDHPLARFYGRISYSFYLWHLFCLLLVSQLTLAWIPKQILWPFSLAWATVLWALSTLLATAVSYGSYRWVERPLIELSKRICRWINLRFA